MSVLFTDDFLVLSTKFGIGTQLTVICGVNVSLCLIPGLLVYPIHPQNPCGRRQIVPG